MSDLDVLIHPDHTAAAFRVLEKAGCRRSQTLVRDDFFPRYYYEAEFTCGSVAPVVIDVHVRPFRLLRYARCVPDDALWRRARPAPLGRAEVLLPCPEEMLIHLAVHAAIHGQLDSQWGQDLRRWVAAYGADMDWSGFVDTAAQWRLNWPVLKALRAVGDTAVPRHAIAALRAQRTNWRDRLALWHAPHDDQHLARQVVVSTITTPGLRFALGYAGAAMFPGREHMRRWYGREHFAWLPVAHAARLLRPLWRGVKALWPWGACYELAAGAGGPCVVARRAIRPGKCIGTYRVRPFDGRAAFAVLHEHDDGSTQRFTMGGKLRYLSGSDQPNARLEGLRVVAMRPIQPGEAITIAPQRSTRVGASREGAMLSQGLAAASRG